MPELVQISTKHFELSIWCKDLSARKSMYQSTLSKRSASNDNDSANGPLEVRFSPPIEVSEATLFNQTTDRIDAPVASLRLPEPVFFENMQYQFEWVFTDDVCDVDNAYLSHPNILVNQGFRFAPKRRHLPARLTGTISTGNDVGWMRLPLEYSIAGQIHRIELAFEVLPTKMDLHADLPVMYRDIDKTFPLWRFSLSEKTAQDVSRGEHRGYFPLLWLANFGRLRQQLIQGLNVIMQAPHSRLQTHVTYVRAERLHGRIPHQLATKVRTNLRNGQIDRRYRIENKRLRVDTPENRFIKMVVTQSANRLAEFESRLRTVNMAPDKQRLSDSFLNELHSWQQPLRKIKNQSFLSEVGQYTGMTNESLVLQQKTGYSLVYRIWQELKFYLDLFSAQTSVSMKSVAQIYEIWCFLQIRNILIDRLGFRDISPEKRRLTLNQFFEYQMKDGFAGAFQFERDDGIKAELAHEPAFNKRGIDIRSYLVTQKPDIVLQVVLPEPDKKKFVWVFDAKYRIESTDYRGESALSNEFDRVPEDAINQMHRYRDALIRISVTNETDFLEKSRPVVGAFALYPGYFDQKNAINPYMSEIDEVGIGAFATLPGEDGAHWLTEFLVSQIGEIDRAVISKVAKHLKEKYYISEPARISYYGMKQVYYPDLTLTAAMAGRASRNSSYFEAFEQGSAKWYHMPVKTFLGKYRQHIAQEIRFLALASKYDPWARNRVIDKIWPVVSVEVVQRRNITAERAGKDSESPEPYYLFELGKPLNLKDPISGVPNTPFRNSMRLTQLSLLDAAKNFAEVEIVYDDALV